MQCSMHASLFDAISAVLLPPRALLLMPLQAELWSSRSGSGRGSRDGAFLLMQHSRWKRGRDLCCQQLRTLIRLCIVASRCLSVALSSLGPLRWSELLGILRLGLSDIISVLCQMTFEVAQPCHRWPVMLGRAPRPLCDMHAYCPFLVLACAPHAAALLPS